MTLDEIGFESLYPSAELHFHATGLMHTVNRHGHSASPCGRPLLNRMGGDSSFPFMVCAAIFVFQLSHQLTDNLKNPFRKLVEPHDLPQLIMVNTVICLAHIYSCDTEVTIVSMTVQRNHTIYHKIISSSTTFRFRSSLALFH